MNLLLEENYEHLLKYLMNLLVTGDTGAIGDTLSPEEQDTFLYWSTPEA